MDLLTYIRLESFRTTTITTYTAVTFVLHDFSRHLVGYSFLLFLFTKLKLEPTEFDFKFPGVEPRPLHTLYCQIHKNTVTIGNLSVSDTKTLLNIFFYHFYMVDTEFDYPSLLKIGNRIFITKDDTSFPSDSFSLVKDREYMGVWSFLHNQQNHPFFPKYRISTGKDCFLSMPELPESLIHHLRDLYKGLLEEFSILTVKGEYEERCANTTFEYLIGMYNFFNIDKESR